MRQNVFSILVSYDGFLVEITPACPYLKRRKRKFLGAFFSRNYALLSTLSAPQAKNVGGF